MDRAIFVRCPRMGWRGTTVLFVLTLLSLRTTAHAQVVISQVYGGGGNMGAQYRNDFIELFNAGSATANINGWSVQYASATTSFWSSTTLSGMIPPGGYFLIQEAGGAGAGIVLPTPDAVG